MSDRLADYRYDLPAELIADRPAEHREDSRMLVLNRSEGTISHRGFLDLPGFLTSRDLLVLNDSRVIPARLRTEDGTIEMLLLEQRDPVHWTAMVRPGRKMRTGAVIAAAETTATVEEVLEDGTRLIRFGTPPDLDRFGEMPIPPYFHRRADESDRERYQTVFARDPGSVAAPTAGLHFTPEVLSRIPHAFVTLQVGAGTFQPVKTEDLSAHRMHHEAYTLSSETASRINATRAAGGRIVAVGTTAARVLESQPPGELRPATGSTDIFIRPPRPFLHVDALLTNFHLPESTLLMLISALAGRERILEAYAEAVRERYRFFSYGDCMLIV
jgi:S-adenosylmethionine:tRNA ribosyltransferase-isomerase